MSKYTGTEGGKNVLCPKFYESQESRYILLSTGEEGCEAGLGLSIQSIIPHK